MLPISAVYICWQNDDFIDAYLFYPHAQVVFIRRVESDNGVTYCLLVQDDIGFYDFVMLPHMKLWIEDGINGVAAT